MAILFVNNVEYSSGAQSQKLRLENIASDPSSGLYEGRVYYNTASDVVRLYTGGGWIDIGASYNFTAASNTGSSVISDGDTLTINGGTALTGSMSGDTITIDHDDYGTAGTYAYPSSIQTNAQGHVISVTAGSAPATPSDATITLTAGSGLADGGAFTLNQASNETITFNVGAGAGIQVNNNDVAIDYSGNNNIIDSAADGTTLVAGDKFIAEDITDNIVKEYEIQDILDLVPAGSDTTYQLGVGAGGTNTSTIELDASSGTDTSITLSGTSSTIKVTENTASGVITLDLQDDVEIVNDLQVGSTLNVEDSLNVDNETTLGGELSGTTATFSGQVTIPVTPTAAASAASKSYVDSTLAGSGALIFQGGYNAATNTPDLDVNPSSSIKQGWTYAVTAAGSFFGEAVEDGDLLIAESDAPTTLAAWTVVQNNIGIATAGSTDGGTTKGIAGFNSAHFNITSNGWVSSDIYGGGSTLGIVPSGGASTTFLRGDGTWQTPTAAIGVATTSTLGLVKLGSDTDQTVAGNNVTSTVGRSYKVQLNSSDQMLVNVPWTDTNTQRAAGTGLSLSGNTINANVDGTNSVAANASSSTASRTYKIQVDSGDNLVVNIPWTDTNTQDVTSVDETTPGTSSGTPIVVNPTTGNVLVKSMAYDGGSNIGHVPAGGSATTFLRGDGTWVTPTDTGALGKRIVLNSALAYVSKADSGGIRTFTVDVSNASVFGSGTVALDVKCEVITAAGQTVYADITRSSADLDVAFTGTPADSAYEVLLTYVG